MSYEEETADLYCTKNPQDDQIQQGETCEVFSMHGSTEECVYTFGSNMIYKEGDYLEDLSVDETIIQK